MKLSIYWNAYCPNESVASLVRSIHTVNYHYTLHNESISKLKRPNRSSEVTQLRKIELTISYIIILSIVKLDDTMNALSPKRIVVSSGRSIQSFINQHT